MRLKGDESNNSQNNIQKNPVGLMNDLKASSDGEINQAQLEKYGEFKFDWLLRT